LRSNIGEQDMNQAEPQISVDYKDGATVVTFRKEKILDDADIQTLSDSMFGLLKEIQKVNLILDFHHVGFMSSVVLGLLIRLSKKVAEKGGQIKLCGINNRIYQAFEITGLDKIFDIHQNVDEALKDALAGGKS
jgi:anti-anti-sigma factor